MMGDVLVCSKLHQILCRGAPARSNFFDNLQITACLLIFRYLI